MASTRVLFSLALVLICCVTLSYSLQCYSCSEKKACKNPPKIQCTSAQANRTRDYLGMYYKNVGNTTSPYMECFRDFHKSSSGEFYYKGCIYSNTKGCLLEMKELYTQGKFEHNCDQCSKNACNPAGRAELHLAIVFVATVLAFVKLI